jgi:hypothetical protein
MKHNIFCLNIFIIICSLISTLPLQAAVQLAGTKRTWNAANPAATDTAQKHTASDLPEKVLFYNWIAGMRHKIFAKLLSCAGEVKREFFTTQRTNQTVAKLESCQDGCRVALYFRDSTGTTPDILYADHIFNLPAKDAIDYAHRKIDATFDKYHAPEEATQTYRSHSAGLMTLYALANEKWHTIDNNPERYHVLMLYINPLLHLIAVADDDLGFVTNSIDRLLYLAIIQWLENKTVAAVF